MLNSKSLLKVSAGLILVSTIGFSAKAQAQSVDVPFNGDALNSCAFTVPTAGTLAKTDAFASMEGSTGVTGFGIGTAGKVSVNCSSGGNLTVAVPANIAMPVGFAPAVVQSVVQRGINTAATDFTSANAGGSYDQGAWTKATTPLVLPTGNSDLNVAMIAGVRSTGSVPSGNYKYNVMLTVVSN